MLHRVLHGNDLEMVWWHTCKDVSFPQMEDEEEGEPMGTGMEGKRSGSEDHFRWYDITDEVLKPLRSDDEVSCAT